MGRQKAPKQLEKLISYILGRRPDEFGLVLNDQGFVRLKDLLKAISEEPGWGYVRQPHIREVLMTSCEKSFVIDNDKIKAVCRDDVPACEEEIVPPKLLYHCVRPRAYPVICRQGIIPLGKPRVYLATTEELAQRMGKRRAPDPVLLTVLAQRAFKAGVTFSKQGDLIYMTDHVPVGYFTGPPPQKDKKKEAPKLKEPVAIPENTPGSFTFQLERSRTLQQQRLRRKGPRNEIVWKKEARRLRRKRKT